MNFLFIFVCLINYVCLVTSDDDLSFDTNDEIVTSEMSACDNSTTDCYYNQVTDPFPLNFIDSSTEHSNLSDVTTKASAASSSSKPQIIQRQEKRIPEKSCHCDIMRGSCNINCCCDIDCSEWERDAFSECLTMNPVSSTGLCISSDIIYRNNTPYPLVKSEDGFFCISKDNFPERNIFIDQGIITSEKMFERVWKRKKHYNWKTYHPPEFITFMKSEKYKYGDPIWIYSNSTSSVHHLAFPAPISSLFCGQEKQILYLQNFKSDCITNVPLTEEECTSYGFINFNKIDKGFVLISSPSLVNRAPNTEGSLDAVFTVIKYELCSDNGCSEVDEYPTPEFDSVTYNCKNILKSFFLQIVHNGSNGIIEAKYQVNLTSAQIAKSPTLQMLQRTYIVEFLSARLSNSTFMFKRSGTPGYRVGLPVITGLLEQDQVVKKRYLTVASGPNCSETTEVLFGESSRTQCIFLIPLESTHNCTHIENEISKLLRMEISGDMIGTTGDPDTWLKRPIPETVRLRLPEPHQPCLVTTSLSLDFLYSYSGSVLRPTANIIGVSSALSGQRFIDCTSSIYFCSVRLVSVVSFTDTSRPAVSKYATPPVVKIKLPPDFFYPFSSSASHLESYKKRHAFAHIVFYACLLILILFLNSYS